MRRSRRCGCGVVLALACALFSSAAWAASPVADAAGASFSYVPALGHSTLPSGAYLTAEHFTFSLLDVHADEDGKQVLAAIEPYTASACLAKQQAILQHMAPAFMGLNLVIEGAAQSGPQVVNVEFGGTDQLTQFAIYGLVKSYEATMRVGLSETKSGWRVTSAVILHATHSKPACS